MTLYEFINSYRDSNDSPPLEITSDETIEALQKIKEMKDEIGEGILFFKKKNQNQNNKMK